MQVLIIDVQNTYRKHCHNVILPIAEYAKNFDSIVYLFDNIDGQEYNQEVPEEWGDDDPNFVERFQVIDKNYAFFRDLMDLGVDEDDEELVKLARFLRSKNLADARDISNHKDIEEAYKKEFKNSPLMNVDFHSYSFYLPLDLMESLESMVKSGVVLVGGARNECLKEVALLLRVLDISYTINEELTY